MLKDFLWNVFEHTGDINSYVFFSELKEGDPAEDQRTIAEAEAATSKNPA